jgi:hypothetical protein
LAGRGDPAVNDAFELSGGGIIGHAPHYGTGCMRKEGDNPGKITVAHLHKPLISSQISTPWGCDAHTTKTGSRYDFPDRCVS